VEIPVSSNVIKGVVLKHQVDNILDLEAKCKHENVWWSLWLLLTFPRRVCQASAERCTLGCGRAEEIDSRAKPLVGRRVSFIAVVLLRNEGLASSLELLWPLAHAELYTMPCSRLKSHKTGKDITMRKTEETLAVEASALRSNGSRDLRHMLVHGSRIWEAEVGWGIVFRRTSMMRSIALCECCIVVQGKHAVKARQTRGGVQG